MPREKDRSCARLAPRVRPALVLAAELSSQTQPPPHVAITSMIRGSNARKVNRPSFAVIRVQRKSFKNGGRLPKPICPVKRLMAFFFFSRLLKTI